MIRGRAIVPGTARGTVLRSDEPLSFWGGYDQETGEIIDRRHPLSGKSGVGRILALPFTRGSSTTTAVLLEAVRRETAPAAIVTPEVDLFLSLASVVAGEMYGRALPVVVVDAQGFAALRDGGSARIDDDGTIHLGETS